MHIERPPFDRAEAVGLLLVAWMLAQFAAIGLLLPGMQFGFLAVGGVLIALGLTGARLARDGESGVRTGRPDGPSSGGT